MSHHFHLHPPGVWELTWDEWERYIRVLNEIAAEQKKAERQAKRNRR